MPNSVFCQFVATGRPADITRLWNAASLPAREVPALSSLLEHASRPLPRNCTPLDVFRQVEATELFRREGRFFDFTTLAPRYRFPGGRQYRGSRVADVTSRLGSRDSLAIEFNVDWLMPPGFWGAFSEAWPNVDFASSWACEMGTFVGYAVRSKGVLQEREVEDARRFAVTKRERDKAFAPLLDALRSGRPYRFLASDPTPTCRRLAIPAGIDMANVVHVATRAELAAVRRSMTGDVLPALPPPRVSRRQTKRGGTR
jgi:hypothetical protein